MSAGRSVPVRVPGALRELAGGSREVRVEVTAGACVREVFDALGTSFPALERRIRDEQGALRRHVNVFVGEENVRDLDLQATPVPEGAQIYVIPAVSGG